MNEPGKAFNDAVRQLRYRCAKCQAMTVPGFPPSEHCGSKIGRTHQWQLVDAYGFIVDEPPPGASS